MKLHKIRGRFITWNLVYPSCWMRIWRMQITFHRRKR